MTGCTRELQLPGKTTGPHPPLCAKDDGLRTDPNLGLGVFLRGLLLQMCIARTSEVSYREKLSPVFHQQKIARVSPRSPRSLRSRSHPRRGRAMRHTHGCTI